MAKTCARMCASLLAFAASGMACAGLTYSNDQRFVRAQTSFGGNQIKQPPVALGVFSETAVANSVLPSGSCHGEATQTSSLGVSGMTASGNASPSVNTTESSGLIFGATGASVFRVSFTPDSDGIMDLQGSFTGSAAGEFVLLLKAGEATLVSSTTGGAFDVSSLIFAGVTYTVEVSARVSAFAFYLAAPVSSSANAGFTLNAGTRAATCPGDLNADGFVDDADFSIFAAAYNLLDCADPAMVPGCPADLNNDGLVDDADFTVFAPAYDALLCG
ncbi:MAG: hypothetical protein K2Y21_09785 [Phycisphaerales bacterium]|nr:hypothetical protein [Phycisphaerales bacterium]